MVSFASRKAPILRRGLATATRLSGSVCANVALARLGSLARASLLLVGVGNSSVGCLVTSTPTYEQPQQTPPVLLANSWANPPLEDPKVLRATDGDPNPRQPFQAAVVSEDAGETVKYSAFLDYGGPGSLNPVDFEGETEAGTLAEGPRKTQPVFLKLSDVSGLPGVCHTLTLVASHDFYQIGPAKCPTCQSDSSQLTWIVEYCADQSQCLPEGQTCASLLHHDAPWSNICHDQTQFCEFPTPMPGSDAGTGATP